MLAFDFVALLAHVSLGTIAVAMGAVALVMQKGGGFHVGAGRVFVFCMGLSSILGALLGALQHETLWITFHAGLLGATLVASGVLVLRIRLGSARQWFMILASANALNMAGLLGAGLYATTLPEARLFNFPAGDYFFLSGMAAIACGGDLRIIFGTSVPNSRRIAQHLLRMCIGFFIAAGSAFTGPGAKVFPVWVQDSGVLSLPELMIIVCMLVWLWKTLRKGAVKSKQPTPITH